MRADRLLSALLLLQAHGRMTSRQLATRLEISERTAHRDMEALSAAGVPVLSVRGSRGGWQLDEQWRTRVPGLDEAELRAFLMAQPRVIGDAPLAAAAERAVDKLMAALPPSMRERATSIRQRLFVDTTGWYGSVEDLSALPVVQDAVSRDRKLAFRYKDEERAVDPLGLVAKGTSWYLVANTANGYRTFRVSRMQQVRALDVRAERPAGFDLAEHWNASTREFRARSVQFEATLRVDPGAAAELKQWRPVTHLATEDDGWVQLRTSFADADHARFVVLGLGRRVTVLAPDSLREQVAADIAAAFERLHEKPPAEAGATSGVPDSHDHG